MSNTDNTELQVLKTRLKNALAAEEVALTRQSTSNSEGDVNAVASLKHITDLIDSLTMQIKTIEGGGASTGHMYWEL